VNPFEGVFSWFDSLSWAACVDRRGRGRSGVTGGLVWQVAGRRIEAKEKIFRRRDSHGR